MCTSMESWLAMRRADMFLDFLVKRLETVSLQFFLPVVIAFGWQELLMCKRLGQFTGFQLICHTRLTS